LLGAASAGAGGLATPVVEPPFDADYSVADLGAIDGLPTPYGGMTFMQGDPNTLLIGGEANSPSSSIYSVPVIRDGNGRITGFGTAEFFADAAYIDGGLTYYEDVLFYARYQGSLAEIGQIKPGSTSPDKVVDLSLLGVTGSAGGLLVIPPGHPGAGQMKLTSYEDGHWYTLDLAADGAGTFDVTAATSEALLPVNGPEQAVVVPRGAPQFENGHVLINGYNGADMTVFELDDDGNPIPETGEPFLSNLGGPDGAARDPLSGELLTSNYDGSQIFLVNGFPAYMQGDLNCDNVVDGRDPLTVILDQAGVETGGPEWCRPLAGEIGTAAGSESNPLFLYGDVSCDSAITVMDAVVLLKYLAGLPTGVSQACMPVGTLVFIAQG
jgi:hypothetical protein